MALFEFLMILLSIIIGLGISEILTGFARILRAGRLGGLGVEYCHQLDFSCHGIDVERTSDVAFDCPYTVSW